MLRIISHHYQLEDLRVRVKVTEAKGVINATHKEIPGLKLSSRNIHQHQH